MSALLEVTGLSVRYGQLQAVTDVSMRIEEGKTVAVIGANGAGKSTLLAAIAGLRPPVRGSIVFLGQDVLTMPAHRRLYAGLCLVPEGRRLFPSLSVEDNLLTGTYCKRKGPWSLERVLELFPWMKERRHQSATQLSGGEQQAVAVGRGLLTNPRLLLLDELSLGLAPVVVRRIYAMLPRIVGEGTSILLVEQDVSQALRVADHIHCLLEGRTVLEGHPRELSAQAIEAAYFGVSRAARPNDGKEGAQPGSGAR
jgi:branched-chain amino acid transport system ATP-binding protein